MMLITVHDIPLLIYLIIIEVVLMVHKKNKTTHWEQQP